jgi:hypothetical protein
VRGKRRVGGGESVQATTTRRKSKEEDHEGREDTESL